MYYQKWKADDGNWYWHLRAANHEIISHGEGYVGEQNCDHGIALNKSSRDAPVNRA